MAERRLLIYSHDSFGLGHLRRCRSIAQSLVQKNPDLNVLILSGLPLIASYMFDERVSFRLVPGIIKTQDGDYQAISKEADIRDVIEARSRVILETAKEFKPDVFLVDKEPLGVRGEVLDTLDYLKTIGTPVVLGLRDVMDDPVLFAAEWSRKQAVPALEQYFEEVWVYGLKELYEPLRGLKLPNSVKQKLVYTSYLRREENAEPLEEPLEIDKPFLLVTPGGGGDGESMVDWVLRGLEADPSIPLRILLVCGPFMNADVRAGFEARASKLPNVTILTFTAGMEHYIEAAAGIVAMGGYNTFCEILSFDRPALIIPRTRPRKEQYIRAVEAQRHGLLSVLVDDDASDPHLMAAALRRVQHQKRPSEIFIPGLLDGHEIIDQRFNALTRQEPVYGFATAAGGAT
ncbi:glycosyltransferase family protein [Lacibacterium aquatile]|uniref:Glycosyltransferase family protein n=1 Tax=Lacibacterium aquatile TaxID=1168082 RepID=A0ABW5DT54_9PROT